MLCSDVLMLMWKWKTELHSGWWAKAKAEPWRKLISTTCFHNLIHSVTTEYLTTVENRNLDQLVNWHSAPFLPLWAVNCSSPRVEMLPFCPLEPCPQTLMFYLSCKMLHKLQTRLSWSSSLNRQGMSRVEMRSRGHQAMSGWTSSTDMPTHSINKHHEQNQWQRPGLVSLTYYWQCAPSFQQWLYRDQIVCNSGSDIPYWRTPPI